MQPLLPAPTSLPDVRRRRAGISWPLPAQGRGAKRAVLRENRAMTEFQEKRRTRRVAIAGHLGGCVHVPLEVRFVDLSLTGVRIEHVSWLRPGSACTLEFPPALGSLVLSARVIHSAVMGSEVNPEGYRLVRYRSGLVFVDFTAAQAAILADVLEKLTPAGGTGEERPVP